MGNVFMGVTVTGPSGQGVHAGHAHEAGLAVDLDRTRTTLTGLAVPATGEVGRFGCLDAVNDVENDFAFVLLQRVALKVATRGVASPRLVGLRQPSVGLLKQGF